MQTLDFTAFHISIISIINRFLWLQEICVSFMYHNLHKKKNPGITPGLKGIN